MYAAVPRIMPRRSGARHQNGRVEVGPEADESPTTVGQSEIEDLDRPVGVILMFAGLITMDIPRSSRTPALGILNALALHR
jgi:hypothetical protein